MYGIKFGFFSSFSLYLLFYGFFFFFFFTELPKPRSCGVPAFLTTDLYRHFFFNDTFCTVPPQFNAKSLSLLTRPFVSVSNLAAESMHDGTKFLVEAKVCFRLNVWQIENALC
jgi:hypothetical protein